MKDSVITFKDGTQTKDMVWFNLEDLLRTLQNRGQGIDKKKLRPLLEKLSKPDSEDEKLSGYLIMREGSKQDKSQSKGEFALTDKAKFWFQENKRILSG